MTDRLKQVSLRKFRTEIADIREVVEVSRRDTNGNIHILGFWTPYMTDAPDSKPVDTTGAPTATVEVKDPGGQTIVAPQTLEIPLGDDPEDAEDQAWLASHSVPRVIKTPEEAAVAVAPNPVRAVPKPSQKQGGKKR